MMAEKAQGFREIAHTADWELEAWAPDFAGLVEQAARGMMALSRVRLEDGPRQQHVLTVQGVDREALLVNFLSELLFVSETERIGFDAFEIKLTQDGLEAHAHGAPIAAQEKEIKAVTYHNLEIRCSLDGLRVNIVFDV
jgi:SHS2 domain-containing protein